MYKYICSFCSGSFLGARRFRIMSAKMEIIFMERNRMVSFHYLTMKWKEELMYIHLISVPHNVHKVRYF
jgi:hypothetical protein